jgi:tRNA(Ile)-lysidine synthase
LRRRVIRRWLQAGGATDLSRSHVLAVESLVLDWHGQRAIQVPGVDVVREDGTLRLRTASNQPG